VNPFKYLAQVKSELSLVAWPKPSGVIRLTVLVVLISAIVGLYLSGLDLGFTKIIGIIISR